MTFSRRTKDILGRRFEFRHQIELHEGFEADDIGFDRWSYYVLKPVISDTASLSDTISGENAQTLLDEWLPVFIERSPSSLAEAIAWQDIAAVMERPDNQPDCCGAPEVEHWFQIVRRELVSVLEPFKGPPGHRYQSQITTRDAKTGLLSLRQQTPARTRIGIALCLFMDWNRTGLFYDELDWLQLDAGRLLLHEQLLSRHFEKNVIQRRGKFADQFDEFESQKSDIGTALTASIVKQLKENSGQEYLYGNALNDVVAEIAGFEAGTVRDKLSKAKRWLMSTQRPGANQLTQPGVEGGNLWGEAVIFRIPLSDLSQKFGKSELLIATE
ncbi:MAG: hypothetical protein IPP97_19015 [Candidatus Obscuribacter sp.]|nr:hypothetical protein [Candidatus Obscuribacter sp.]MBP6348762.1 hypothetical protein [Candidatus Obscuribacter sp.]MBP6591642.1 hypothetical protein [Candidatus Obscuribacter sp.]MBP7575826.1 hypothetical protein [Candidatus Obscuribacter sp.]